MTEIITFSIGLAGALFLARQTAIRYADRLEKDGYIEGDYSKAWRGYWIKRKLWSR